MCCHEKQTSYTLSLHEHTRVHVHGDDSDAAVIAGSKEKTSERVSDSCPHQRGSSVSVKTSNAWERERDRPDGMAWGRDNVIDLVAGGAMHRCLPRDTRDTCCETISQTLSQRDRESNREFCMKRRERERTSQPGHHEDWATNEQ